MSFWDKFSKFGRPPTIEDIYMAPAHLIRRYQQISAAIFVEELGDFGLTPIQYASLLAIRDNPGIDQRALGNMIAVDRSTIARVVKDLEKNSFVRRVTPSENLRIKQLYIEEDGEKLLSQTVEEISRVQQRLLAPLTPEDQDTFMELLSRLVQVNNEFSRVPQKLK